MCFLFFQLCVGLRPSVVRTVSELVNFLISLSSRMSAAPPDGAEILARLWHPSTQLPPAKRLVRREEGLQKRGREGGRERWRERE